jgi:hypothetical protein
MVSPSKVILPIGIGTAGSLIDRLFPVWIGNALGTG